MSKIFMRKLWECTFENKVVVSDPCYEKNNGFNLEVSVLPGIYELYQKVRDTEIQEKYSEEILTLTVIKKDSWLDADYKKRNTISLGNASVDSGQMSIINSSTYPKTKEENGSFDNKESFYGKCCSLTLNWYDEANKYWSAKNLIKNLNDKINDWNLSNEDLSFYKKTLEEAEKKLLEIEKKNIPYLQGGIIENKGVVSSTLSGDGDYPVLWTKNNKGEIVAIDVIF